MDVIALGYFISLAELGNFSEAADRNYVSQSSLSKIIIKLEAELGVKLFNRKSHPIKLTPAGNYFYKHARNIQIQYNQAINGLHNYKENKSIYCYTVPKSFAIRNAINDFSENNPDILVKSDMSSDFETVVEVMIKRDVDFAITHRPLELPPQIKSTYLYDDDLYVVVSKKHEFAMKNSVNIAALSGYEFIETPFSRSLLITLSKYYNFVPKKINPNQGTIYREEVLLKVARCEGISIYFGRDISYYKIDNVVPVKLDGVRPIPMVLLHNENHTLKEWHGRFHDFVKKNLKSYVGELF